MNWNAVIAGAEVVAAAGVILTLTYLAAQIRHNTSAVRRAAYQELLDHIAQLNMLLATERELAEIFQRSRTGLDRLDEVEQMRALAWFGTVCRHYQNAYHQYLNGFLKEGEWHDMSAPIQRLLANQGGRDMWAVVRGSFHADFQRLIEQAAGPAPVADEA